MVALLLSELSQFLEEFRLLIRLMRIVKLLLNVTVIFNRSCNIFSDILWQTFGRLRLELNQFIQRERDFSSRSS